MPIPQNQILCAEIHLVGQAAARGSNAINTDFVFHYRRITTAVTPNKGNLYFAFAAAVVAPIAAALNVSWTESMVRIRWPNDPLDIFFDVIATTPGAIAGDRMSTEDSAYLHFQTGLRGRSYRGGKHLGPMSESDTSTATEDLFNAGCLTRLAAINTALLAGLTDADGNQWVFALLSRKLSNFNVTPCVLVLNDVTQAKVNKRVGSMLRRKVKSVY